MRANTNATMTTNSLSTISVDSICVSVFADKLFNFNLC